MSFVLNGIIGQMCKIVMIIFIVISVSACSNISFFAPITFCFVSQFHNQNKTSDIEFPFMEQKRVRYVLLNNEGMTLLFLLFPRNYIFNLLKCFTQCYSASTVWIFSRLYNPKVIVLTFMLLVISLEFGPFVVF